MAFPFKSEHRKEGDLLIQAGHIKNLVFSEGTYQVEIEDPHLKATFWPFLQIDDEGHLKDAFCTCEIAEKKKSCPHLAAAYLEVNREEPLHIEFHKSFWNHLCFMAFKRHGADCNSLTNAGENEYVCLSETGEVLFKVKDNSEKGKDLLSEFIFKRTAETEETSLKFSNLSSEELLLWKRGTPSQKLQYELSFWSDLAKWMLVMQLFRVKYSIDFKNTDEELPKRVALYFPDLCFEFYIAKVNWEELIPSLRTVNAPLKVHSFKDIQIKEMTYDPAAKEIQISAESFTPEKETSKKRMNIGEWEYVNGEGFYPTKMSDLLKKKMIPEDQIGAFLTENIKVVEKYLKNTSISKDPIIPSYQLHFDSHHRLHISCYVLEEGDLELPKSAFFKPWVYIDQKGFFRLQGSQLDTIETIIPPEKMGDFIHEHRLWLNQHEGFQTHLSNVEFRLTYHFDLKVLKFESELQVYEDSKAIIDFGDWLYIKEKGFYKKLKPRGIMAITPGMEVERKQIPSFIYDNREELEQIQGFFSPEVPIEKAGLNIWLNEQGKIVVDPEYVYMTDYMGKQVHFIGNFTYIEGEGFAELPPSERFPEKFRKKTTVSESQEPYFINVELAKLEPYIFKIDKRLKVPKNLALKLKYLRSDPKQQGKKWYADFVYESEFGEETVGNIKQALDQNRSYAITEAGLIFFKDSRFNWLRELLAKQVIHQGETVTLSTLEWIRLRTFEEVTEPKEDNEKGRYTRELLGKLDHFETSNMICLDALKSILRPYQSIGVKWLWFLYTYGLSGLLCDDMGLGKTHQAMALLAAAHHMKGDNKSPYFVVCPTSVIYHWEELLSRFLPSFNVVVFYGAQRTLKDYTEADVVLTSYGTLRSEIKALSKISFDIAIFDEIQIAKNPQSQTHQSLTKLRANTKIGLTGTPIENRLLELKALFDIILPKYFPSQTQYREHFINPIEKHKDAEKKALLAALIHPFVLRRKKSEVLDDLPEKFEEIAQCHLSDEQRILYKDAYLRSKDELIKDLENPDKHIPYMHVFALLNTLKQICNHPSLVLKDVQHYKKHASGKWDLFVELLEEARASHQKLVVFTQFLDMMNIIEMHLKENKIGYASIRGSTQDRKEQLQKFRSDPDCEVFVASLKAAGTGIELTAASVVIHYDRWWNPAKENQATDRVHRIGQNRGVQVFKMMTKHTIEEYIHALIERKIELFEGVIGYDDQDQIKHFDRDDLLALFQHLNSDI